jgi:hypothetical protein
MVGLLTALRGTDLNSRLEREGRLLAESSGNNVDIALNFVPELDRDVLIDGYRKVLASLYGPDLRSYFARCRTLVARLGRWPRPQRGPSRAELLALLRSLRLQLFSRQGPAYAAFLAHTLLTRPMGLAKAIRLAIKGLHLQRFTAQMLATHAFRATALEGYERAEGLLERAVTARARLRRTIERHVIRTTRRLRRRYRRLRPEFRQGLLPDRMVIESALRELVREVSSHELVKRWIPRFETTFSNDTWRRAIETEGYEPFGGSVPVTESSIVSLAPLVADGRLRRAVEGFFRELGVRVVTTGEQLACLGQDRLEQIHGLAEAPERLRSYLHAMGQRIDTLVVPVADELAGLSGRVQILAAKAADRASGVPRLVCIRLEGSRREVRTRLIELGIALTGDADRAEAASDRALALT